MATKKKDANAETVAFHVNKWNGVENYNCSKCGFASLERGALAAHVKTVHKGTLAKEASEAPTTPAAQ